MRRTISAFLLAGVLASVASAAPLLCTVGTMADYVALGATGCTISDKLFINFFYASTSGGNGVAVIASNVTVVPDFSSPSNPGFHFVSTGWNVSSVSTNTFTSFVDSSIQFGVRTISGEPLIEDNTLTLDVFNVINPGSGAFGDVAETLLPSGQTYGVDTNGPFIDHKTFAPTNLINVTKDLIVAAPGGSNSTVSITQFSENFSQVPEPLSFLLLGSGLLVVGLRRRR